MVRLPHSVRDFGKITWHRPTGTATQTLSDGFRLVLQLLRLIVGYQRVQNRLELAVHYIRELVQCQADAVIGHAVLREVVGADLLAAVAAANLRFALLGQRLLLLFHLHLIKTGAEHAHAFFTVLDLRLLVLAADNRIGRQVCDAYGRVSRIYRLAARTRRTERIDAQVLGFNLDVNVFGFWQDSYCYGRGVDAALLLGCRHALNAMHAAFILQSRVNAFAFYDGDNFLQPAYA